MDGDHRSIDAHAHLKPGGWTPAMLAEADRLGIGHIMLCNIGEGILYPTRDEVRTFNHDCAQWVRHNPERFSGYAYLNPRHGTRATLDELKRSLDEGLIGVKLWIATFADDPALLPVIEYAAGRRLPVLAHTWDKSVGQLPHESTAVHIARLARAVPEAVIIMAHLGGFVPRALGEIVDLPNVMTDTSGSVIGAGDVAAAIDILGPERVVFGSDAPGACLATNVGKIVDAGLDEESARLVMGGTMAKVLAEVQR